jgi:ribonuclease BN (tRNA processing enzyme)
MKLHVIGSSDAFNGGGRCNASYLVHGDGLPTVAVDFGTTTLLGLRRAGVSTLALDAVFITHLHGDHFGGLPFLILDAMYHDRRTRPLTLVGPIGFRARLGALFEALYRDIWLRERPFETTVIELAPGDTYALGALSVEAFAASHMDPPDVPLCFRMTATAADGTQRILAFSGDTEPCDGLVAATRGADLLVAECSGMAPPCGRHITWEDWRDLFGVLVRDAGVRRIVLSHLGRDVRAAAAELLAAIPEGVSVIFADDDQHHVV